MKLCCGLMMLCVAVLLSAMAKGETPAVQPATQAASQPAGEEHFLFTSFRGNGGKGLFLAHSTDGYNWKPLNNDKSWLTNKDAGTGMMRDPFLAQGPDGTFHLVWTVGWNAAKEGPRMGYARSKDLLTWTSQKTIPVLQSEPNARNVWAPELFYDDAKQQWVIFWSTTIPGKFASTDKTGDDKYNHRFYYVTTKDFETFSDTTLLYDPGFNCIDATMLKVDKKIYLFFKDERKTPLRKCLVYATADSPEGPFSAASEPFTGDWVEGPSAIKIGGEYLVYFDHYASPHYYGAFRSKDLAKWEDCSKQMTFPKDHRHGSVLRISRELAAKLLEQSR